MHCEILGTSNTPPIAWTKIIQSIMFTNYLHEGISFFLGFVQAMPYPSRSPWCFQKTLNRVLFSFQVKVWLCNTPPGFFRCVMEPKEFSYLNKGIACALSNSKHKQYPSNSLDQINSIHGVYRIPSCFLLGLNLLFFGVKKGFLI